jgi:hypothetical protein
VINPHTNAEEKKEKKEKTIGRRPDDIKEGAIFEGTLKIVGNKPVVYFTIHPEIFGALETSIPLEDLKDSIDTSIKVRIQKIEKNKIIVKTTA